jgi:regulator of sigma E protease
MDYLVTAFWFVIVLGVLVLVHEFGHFAVAKLCGVRIETFSIGFGRRLFGIKRGGTDYRISILPLGGYVKMAGDNPGETPTDPGDFNAHPRWQRVLVALAGPTANFILAFVIMSCVGLFHHEVEQYLTRPAVLDWVLPNTPAAQVGLRAGDTIVAFDTVQNPTWRDVYEHCLLNLNQRLPLAFVDNGRRVNTTILVRSEGAPDEFTIDQVGILPVFQDTPIQVLHLESGMPAAAAGMAPDDQIYSIDGLHLHSVEALLAYLQSQGGKPATLDVLRNGQHLSINLIPQIAPTPDGAKLYRIGFQPLPPPTDVVHLSLPAALSQARKDNWHDSKLILNVVRHMFGGRVSVKSLSGPIGIGQQIGLAVKQGKWELLKMMASISLNLGIFNLLPFPVLDGGMVLFLLIESIIRRDVNQVWKERIYQAAFIVLILFAAFVIFNDITKLSPFSHIKL